MKIYMVSLFHRATINEQNRHQERLCTPRKRSKSPGRLGFAPDPLGQLTALLQTDQLVGREHPLPIKNSTPGPSNFAVRPFGPHHLRGPHYVSDGWLQQINKLLLTYGSAPVVLCATTVHGAMHIHMSRPNHCLLDVACLWSYCKSMLQFICVRFCFFGSFCVTVYLCRPFAYYTKRLASKNVF